MLVIRPVWLLRALATLEMIVPEVAAVTETWMLALKDCPAPRVGVVTVVVLPPEHRATGVQATKDTPAGRTSVMTTLFAAPVPVFITCKV